MADGGNNTYEIPIYLKPTDRSGGGAGGEGGEEYLPMGDGKNADQIAAEQFSKSRTNPAKAIITKMVNQVATTALSNYGNITGDYVTGQNLQTLIGEATAIAGAVSMGPVGVALYAIDKGFQLFNYVSQIKRSEAEAAFKQKRVYAADRRS